MLVFKIFCWEEHFTVQNNRNVNFYLSSQFSNHQLARFGHLNDFLPKINLYLHFFTKFDYNLQNLIAFYKFYCMVNLIWFHFTNVTAVHIWFIFFKNCCSKRHLSEFDCTLQSLIVLCKVWLFFTKFSCTLQGLFVLYKVWLYFTKFNCSLQSLIVLYSKPSPT